MDKASNDTPLGRQEEGALKEQMEHYRHMVELNPQVPWVADKEGRLLDFSPRWLELTGLTREQALTVGWTDVPHPDDLPGMLAAWTHSITTSAPLDIEHRIRVADGSFRWMRTRAFPRWNAQGEIVNWYGFTEDIDRRIHAEKALQTSEARYRSIVETAQEGIWMVDAGYRTTFVNARMAEMLGYTREEMLGRSVYDFMDAQELQALEQRRQERQAGRTSQYDARYCRKDGSGLWMIVSAAPLTDEEGRFSGAVALLTDITDRKRWEVEQARLAAIVQSSEDAIVSKDLNGIVTSWNTAAERIYGWKAEEIIGKSKALVIPPDLPDELSSILSKIKAGERIEHYETRRLHKDGTVFDAEISVSPVKDTQGRVIGAATIVRDITERRRTERELQRKQAEVEALNERLKRAMLETHHRVKNNLQIVSAMIDMQAIEYSRERTVPLKELERLGNHIRTLAIVHDVLTKGIREDEEEQRVSSAVVIGQLLGLLEKTSGSHRIQSRVDDVELPSKQAISLALVINELVSNAVKHTASSIEVIFQVIGTLAELSVCDDGTGFPEGFDPLAHANMGLELVQGLVDADLKGQTYFENREEGGACVRVQFRLPTNDMNSHLDSQPLEMGTTVF